MNTFRTLSVIALGSGLVALNALGVQAQTTTPDPTLSTVLSTIPFQAGSASTNLDTYGVGYDAQNAFAAFGGSSTQATSSSYYYGFELNPTTATGTAGTTGVAAGSNFQIGVNATAFSRAGSSTVTFDAKIFNYTGTSGTVGPGNQIGVGSLLFSAPIIVTSHTQPTNFNTYYTATSVLGTTLQANHEYLLELSADPAGTNYVVASAANQPSNSAYNAFNDIFQNQDNNTTTTDSQGGGLIGGQTASFVLRAGTASSVPETSTVLTALLGLAPVGGLILRRRRANARV